MRLTQVEETYSWLTRPDRTHRVSGPGHWRLTRRLRASGSRYLSYDPDDGLETVLDRRI
jgi:hypothetical protein